MTVSVKATTQADLDSVFTCPRISGQALTIACLVTALIVLGAPVLTATGAGSAAVSLAALVIGGLAIGVLFAAGLFEGLDSESSAKPMRRSSLSILASEPTSVLSLDGTSTLAHISSNCSFGLVAPDISDRAAETAPAAWVSSAMPKLIACKLIFSNSSSAIPLRTAFAWSPTDNTTIRSRSFSSKSSTNLLGSCPDWITLSTLENTREEFWVAKASTTSSSSVALV